MLRDGVYRAGMAQGYRPKPALAAWIARERHRLGMKPADLVARLEAVGVQVSEQTVRVWESNADRRPSASNLDALERIFGSQAPERLEPGADQTAIVDAIDRLTRQMEQIAERLDDLRGAEEGRADALQAILLRLVDRVAGNEDAPSRQRAATR